MKLAIFHSVPEALTYFLLFLALLFNIVGLTIGLSAIHQNQRNTQQIDNKIDCIAGYFTMPHRTGNTTINCENK